jgi:ADP-ribosylglycohydrolase
MRERVLGAIIGGAIGDGWGRVYEGMLPPIDPRIPDHLIVTDDTQLTLATCESIAELGHVDPAHVANRFVVWFEIHDARPTACC